MPRKKNHSFVCPIDLALSLLAHKWTLDILRDLLNGKKRTSELLRSLNGISPRTLAQRLRELEGHKLIVRQVFPQVPPKVEYSLTDDGYRVRPLIQELFRLGESLKDVKTIHSRTIESEDCSHCSRNSEQCLAIEQSLVRKKDYKQVNK